MVAELRRPDGALLCTVALAPVMGSLAHGFCDSWSNPAVAGPGGPVTAGRLSGRRRPPREDGAGGACLDRQYSSLTLPRTLQLARNEHAYLELRCGRSTLGRVPGDPTRGSRIGSQRAFAWQAAWRGENLVRATRTPPPRSNMRTPGRRSSGGRPKSRRMAGTLGEAPRRARSTALGNATDW
jgi:hypothetical protein